MTNPQFRLESLRRVYRSTGRNQKYVTWPWPILSSDWSKSGCILRSTWFLVVLGNSSVSHAPLWHLCAHVFPCYQSMNGSIDKFSVVTSWTLWSRVGNCSIFSFYSCWCRWQEYHPQIARFGRLHGIHVHLITTSCRNLRTWRPRLRSVCKTLCLCAVVVPGLSVYGVCKMCTRGVSVPHACMSSCWRAFPCAVLSKNGASISSFVMYSTTSRSWYHFSNAQCTNFI